MISRKWSRRSEHFAIRRSRFFASSRKAPLAALLHSENQTTIFFLKNLPIGEFFVFSKFLFLAKLQRREEH